MIRKTLIVLILGSFSLFSQETWKMKFSQDFVLKPFYGKTPAFIMKQFGKTVDLQEKDKTGLNRWTYEIDNRGKEELLTYTLILKDKNWQLKGKNVFSFQADFYRPLGKKGAPWICWDAFYVLTPKEWEKE